jgi:hypothetical protein
MHTRLLVPGREREREGEREREREKEREKERKREKERERKWHKRQVRVIFRASRRPTTPTTFFSAFHAITSRLSDRLILLS